MILKINLLTPNSYDYKYVLKVCKMAKFYQNIKFMTPSDRGLLNCGLRATDCIAGCGLRVTDCGLRATLRLRVGGHRLRVADCCVAGCGPHVVGC